MNIQKILCCIIFFLSGVALSIAGNLSADSIATRLMYQVWSYPQEKVYIITDRDIYSSGDTIRFRAFLVDAASHRSPVYGSKFIYVELLNPFGEVIERVKLKASDDSFAGIFPIFEDLAEGNYTLRAYTRFMENSGKEYFFRKSVPIFSQLSKKYRLETDFKDGMMTARLMEKGIDRPVRVEKIRISCPDDGEILSRDAKKRSSYSINVNEAMKKAGVVKIKFDRYEKYVTIPTDTAEISLTFHPEGGYLIPNRSNRLAFKALDKNGLSTDFKGIMKDDIGNIIDSIKATHRGMGYIDFKPESGRNYTAVVNGMLFSIPKSEPAASSLRVRPINIDSVNIRIEGKIYPGTSLIAHNGGNVTLVKDLSDESSLNLKQDNLGSGIVQFLLVNNEGNILSSRMIFNHIGYLYNTSLDSLPQGDYTVRKFRDIVPDSTASIVSGLLLQSELKGYIENPDYYFNNRDSITDANLDLLLLTQGWERYDIPSALKGRYSSPEIPMEIGSEISGSVKSRWRSRPLADAVVMMMAPKTGYASQTLSDEDGRFVFNGYDWPENTSFIIQVFEKNGSKEHNFTLDEDVFPTGESIKSKAMQDMQGDIANDQLLTDGTILLDELEVVAPLSEEESHREMLRALGVRSFNSDDFKNAHATTYEEMIRKIPGLRIVNGNVVYAQPHGTYNVGRGGSDVEFWIDGVKWTPTFSHSSGELAKSGAPEPIGDPFRQEHTYVESRNNTLSEFSSIYPLDIIKSMEYYRPTSAMIISMSAAQNGGALVFTTKDGSEIKDKKQNLFIREFKPLGYQKANESYKPHYIYDPTADDRIYKAVWFPVVNDINSELEQTGDNIVIEGIANGFVPVIIRLFH